MQIANHFLVSASFRRFSKWSIFNDIFLCYAYVKGPELASIDITQIMLQNISDNATRFTIVIPTVYNNDSY